ncbi:TlpA family protein disulfide reductase [Dyadobacter frigoris]|uniref:TlpA family protein disulfide reductase n=1 Tax=Dyadobacter frigoris TaxID=2576211 RepID=A0A4U6CW00_9BACT|nr:TlpA disulfide reductase family protein [Dyadobacter frigoris]TKT85494.1 TlpA family protein disulfide reductase [Dyadobacter frigoris]GLU56229.1 hypothetical protein Dfri01_56900 [Dyadobacter frigoris]
MKNTLFLAFIFLFAKSYQLAFAQTPAQLTGLRVGENFPVSLTDTVGFYNKDQKRTVASLAGRFSIIDFWTPGCLSCIESLPKLNKLQAAFGPDLQILMVGKDRLDKNSTRVAAQVYNKYKERYNLDLLVAYNSDLFMKLGVSFVPYVIWVDDKGIVKALTSSTELTAANIEKFVHGQDFEFVDRSAAADKQKMDETFPDGDAASDDERVYSSVLKKWRKETRMIHQPYMSSSEPYWEGMKPNGIRVAGVSLSELYRLAYGDSVSWMPGFFHAGSSVLRDRFARSAYGIFWSNPVLELEDSAEFTADIQTGINLYCYELLVPKSRATTQYLTKLMRQDLMKYFGYQVRVEKREMPCWKLVVTHAGAANKLKSKGLKCIMAHSPASLDMANIPVYQLIRQIWEYNPGELPIIDQTAIDHYIDIHLDAVMNDITDVRKGLQLNGLDLVRSRKEMNVIVVSSKTAD